MEYLLTKKTISMTELREPRKVLEHAGSEPVAVLNRSNVVGYFVPASAVEKLEYVEASDKDVADALRDLPGSATAVNKYLQDK